MTGDYAKAIIGVACLTLVSCKEKLSGTGIKLLILNKKEATVPPRGTHVRYLSDRRLEELGESLQQHSCR